MKSLVVVPNDATGNILFSSFVEGERNGGVLGEEIVNLVLKFGEHGGVLISSLWMCRLIIELGIFQMN
jgi:hypothetical protein